MIQLYQKVRQLKVLAKFMNDPYDEFYLRELARILEMSPMTLKRSLDVLVNDGYIIKFRSKNQLLYKANIDAPFFKTQKVAFNLKLLDDALLVKKLTERITNLTSLVVYGSWAKGENDVNSDIDLLAIHPGKSIELDIKDINGNEVHVLQQSMPVWTRFSTEHKALYQDIIMDGIPLYGTMPVV